jgi:hypothetical protein
MLCKGGGGWCIICVCIICVCITPLQKYTYVIVCTKMEDCTNIAIHPSSLTAHTTCNTQGDGGQCICTSSPRKKTRCACCMCTRHAKNEPCTNLQRSSFTQFNYVRVWVRLGMHSHITPHHAITRFAEHVVREVGMLSFFAIISRRALRARTKRNDYAHIWVMGNAFPQLHTPLRIVRAHYARRGKFAFFVYRARTTCIRCANA